jgi:DNA-directed RNA polymerase subunit F
MALAGKATVCVATQRVTGKSQGVCHRVNAYNNRGNAYENKEDYDHLEKAVSLDPPANQWAKNRLREIRGW